MGRKVEIIKHTNSEHDNTKQNLADSKHWNNKKKNNIYI